MEKTYYLKDLYKFNLFAVRSLDGKVFFSVGPEGHGGLRQLPDGLVGGGEIHAPRSRGIGRGQLRQQQMEQVAVSVPVPVGAARMS